MATLSPTMFMLKRDFRSTATKDFYLKPWRATPRTDNIELGGPVALTLFPWFMYIVYQTSSLVIALAFPTQRSLSAVVLCCYLQLSQGW